MTDLNIEKTEDGLIEKSSGRKIESPLDNWKVGADGIPVKNGDIVAEEDGELVYIDADGTKTKFA